MTVCTCRTVTTWRVDIGDCVELMAAMDEASVDAIVCDPPYGLEFMGKEWDRLGEDRFRAADGKPMQEWHKRWATEALRVLKPGGHLLAFGGTRTYHRLACAIEDAGFEIRDTIAWMYGSGFPKSLDVSKAIDKQAGAEREVVGPPQGIGGRDPTRHESLPGEEVYAGQWGNRWAASETAPATDDARRWEGWGTALKPAHEPIVVARKPLTGTVAANVLEHGTGALSIDGCRVESAEAWPGDERSSDTPNGYGPGDADGWEGNWTKRSGSHAQGRWPANVVLDEEAAAMLDEQSGERPGFSSQNDHGSAKGFSDSPVYGSSDGRYEGRREGYNDSGGASRFFYCAKASRAERNAGLAGFEEQRGPVMSERCRNCGRGRMDGRRDGPCCGVPDYERTPAAGLVRNHHPTVKPVSLMRWLVRLVTPPGGTVLDPFAGSGTTGIAAVLEGFRFIGLERDDEYARISRARIGWWDEHGEEALVIVAREERAESERESVRETGQIDLFTMFKCEDCGIVRSLGELESGCPSCGETMVPSA